MEYYVEQTTCRSLSNPVPEHRHIQSGGQKREWGARNCWNHKLVPCYLPNPCTQNTKPLRYRKDPLQASRTPNTVDPVLLNAEKKAEDEKHARRNKQARYTKLDGAKAMDAAESRKQKAPRNTPQPLDLHTRVLDACMWIVRRSDGALLVGAVEWSVVGVCIPETFMVFADRDQQVCQSRMTWRKHRTSYA